jgi:hypothetical protein
MTKITVSYDQFYLLFLNASIDKGITPYTRTLSGTFNFKIFFQKTRDCPTQISLVEVVRISRVAAGEAVKTPSSYSGDDPLVSCVRHGDRACARGGKYHTGERKADGTTPQIGETRETRSLHRARGPGPGHAWITSEALPFAGGRKAGGRLTRKGRGRRSGHLSL